MKTIGVGIVGLSASGGWAAEAHVPALHALDGYELRALSASSVESAQKAADAYGVGQAFDSAHDLSTADGVDLVVVAVKVPEHRKLVLAALSAGKNVLCEWPLGNGTAEAQEMADRAAARGLSGFVGLQARSAPLIRYLRDLVADGYVGEVLSTTLIGSGGTWGPIVEPRNAYTLDQASGATMLTIPFGHTIDAVAMVLGPLTNVTATTATRRREIVVAGTGESLPMTAEDQVAVTGVLDSGAVAAVHFRGGVSRATNLHWEINGTDGDLIVTGNVGHVQLAQLSLRGAHGDDPALQRLTVPSRYELAPDGLITNAPLAHQVANAYVQIQADLDDGGHRTPTFHDAVENHRLIDAVVAATDRP